MKRSTTDDALLAQKPAKTSQFNPQNSESQTQPKTSFKANHSQDPSPKMRQQVPNPSNLELNAAYDHASQVHASVFVAGSQIRPPSLHGYPVYAEQSFHFAYGFEDPAKQAPIAERMARTKSVNIINARANNPLAGSTHISNSPALLCRALDYRDNNIACASNAFIPHVGLHGQHGLLPEKISWHNNASKVLNRGGPYDEAFGLLGGFDRVSYDAGAITRESKPHFGSLV